MFYAKIVQMDGHNQQQVNPYARFVEQENIDLPVLLLPPDARCVLAVGGVIWKRVRQHVKNVTVENISVQQMENQQQNAIHVLQGNIKINLEWHLVKIV